MSFGDVLDAIDADRRRGVMAVADFVLRPYDGAPIGGVVEKMCELLIAAGVPLDRYNSSTAMVTSEHDAVGRTWRRDEGVEQTVYVGGEGDDDPIYRASPFYAAKTTGQWVDLWLADTPDDLYGIVPQLKAQGITHYLCIHYLLSNGADGWMTFATRHPDGFDEQDLLVLAFALRPLISRIDGRVGWATLDKLLRTYVGDEPHTAILGGRAKRGQVSEIEAAMLVADMRDSTSRTAGLSAVGAVDLFNNLFDCLVPPVESRRGEVLKYLGDGLLAMFRETDYAGSACDRALDAAQGALAAIAAWNADHPDIAPLQVGIALHVGSIAYGNVGSGTRLDFTVIGRDVALATRIAGMNGRLGEPILLSSDFASKLACAVDRVGMFPARGFDAPIEVYRPQLARAGAEGTDGTATRVMA